MKLNGRSREEAVATVPDLETLRWHFRGPVPESEVSPWADSFADDCDLLLSTIRDGLLVAEPSLAGKFVRMPFLPLGHNWLIRIPLLERVWIDRRVVELWEASVLLAANGYSRLPAVDWHSIAWHGFFPPGTRWTSPTVAPHSHFVDALSRAVAAVRKMPAWICLVSGRHFIHIDDYASWAGRRVPGDLRSPDMQEDGISWAKWNAWVHEYGNDGVVEVAGYHLSELHDKWGLRHGEAVWSYDSAKDAEVALEERSPALDKLYAVALSASARSDPRLVMTAFQIRILTKLEGRVMTADELSAELECDRRTLFKPGGTNELCERKGVVNDRKVGGYYRPDCPPTLTKKRALNGHCGSCFSSLRFTSIRVAPQ